MFDLIRGTGYGSSSVRQALCTARRRRTRRRVVRYRQPALRRELMLWVALIARKCGFDWWAIQYELSRLYPEAVPSSPQALRVAACRFANQFVGDSPVFGPRIRAALVQYCRDNRDTLSEQAKQAACLLWLLVQPTAQQGGVGPRCRRVRKRILVRSRAILAVGYARDMSAARSSACPRSANIC